MEQKFCQSCGMPLTEEILGTNADGSKNQDYGEDKNLPHADHPMKKVFIEEVNALGLPELHITNLYVLQGAFVNQVYTINGNEVKLLDDNSIYWGNQVQRSNGRCYGIACDEHHILVSEYGADGANPEIVVFKRR